MNPAISIWLALLITATGASTFAQSPSTASTAGHMPAMTQDCGKAAVKRHDHSAERGTGPTAFRADKAKPCEPMPAASAGAATKTKPVHDHGKVHKTL